MPPVSRPFPRFVADSSQEPEPYGRWEERLRGAFLAECARLEDEAGSPVDPETVRWFPERAWGGRVYLPASARASEARDGVLAEYFGHASLVRPEDGEPTGLRAGADFTDVTADDNPDWTIDLNDEVIGAWRADAGRGGDITLVWGTPLVRGAVAATAELEGEVLDQAPVTDGRFTLIAVDAVRGFGDEDLYVTVRLWDRRLNELASEGLYDEGGEEESEGGEEESEDDEEAERREAAGGT